MQVPGDTSLTQLVAQLAARLDALSARVETLEHSGGAVQGVVGNAAPQPGPMRTMVVDNIQPSDHTDDNSDEINQLQVEVNSLQNTVNSQTDNLDRTVGTSVQTQENVGGEVSNRSDIDRQIAGQREQVERYATQLANKKEELDRLQRAANQPKQILHGHNGQTLIMLQSKFNISGQLTNIAPGDTVTWAGTMIKGDENMQIWLVDIVKEAQP
jgi:predicted RNase H-like nuclease (RuvC/YqgF family)